MSYSIVKLNGEPNSPNLMEIIIDSASDVSSLPTNIADGSIAYVSNYSKVYTLKSGVWVEAV